MISQYLVNDLFHYAWLVIISFLTFEVFMWGVALNNHSRWLKDTDELEKRECFKESWIRMYMASIMATGLSMMVFVWEVNLVVLVHFHEMPHETYMPWIIAGIQLSHIHYNAILARCCCLDVAEWPWGSRKISCMLHKFNLRPEERSRCV